MNLRQLLMAGLVLAGIGPALLLADNRPADKAPAAPAAPAAPPTVQGIHWQPSLAAAITVAQQSGTGKPIVLLRVLGKLDDKL